MQNFGYFWSLKRFSAEIYDQKLILGEIASDAE